MIRVDRGTAKDDDGSIVDNRCVERELLDRVRLTRTLSLDRGRLLT